MVIYPSISKSSKLPPSPDLKGRELLLDPKAVGDNQWEEE
jgi:hypothetical protein